MLRILLTLLSGVVFVCLLIGSSVSAQSTSGPEVVLFPFDDYGLPFNKGLLLNLVPGRKTTADRGAGSDPEHPGRPVLLPGNPGDPDHPRLYYYGTVLHINDEYRMWYTGYDRNGKRLVCYAVSEDGVKWTKPNLGLVEYNGDTNNNLPTIDGGNSIAGVVCLLLYEPDDPNPDRRFKMIREIDPRQINAAYSPDGLRWTESSNNPIIRGSGLELSGLIRFQGVYYLNGQAGPIPHPIKRV